MSHVHSGWAGVCDTCDAVLWTEPEPRSVAFRTDWEPDPEELRAVRDYLIDPPRWDGEDGWPEHCEGLAAGILQTLHVLRGGFVQALPEDEAQRYIAQAHAMGKEIERLRGESALLRDALGEFHEFVTEHLDPDPHPIEAYLCWRRDREIELRRVLAK